MNFVNNGKKTLSGLSSYTATALPQARETVVKARSAVITEDNKYFKYYKEYEKVKKN
jgi:hypothetical protein